MLSGDFAFLARVIMGTFRTDKEAIQAGVITEEQAKQARFKAKHDKRRKAPLPDPKWQRLLFELLKRDRRFSEARYGPLVWEYMPFQGRQYRSDMAWPRLKLAVEVDEFHAHNQLKQMNADRQKDRVYIRHGWRVLRFTDDEVRRHTQQVIDEIFLVCGA